MILDYNNEIRTEIMINDVEWYSIDVDRMLPPKGDTRVKPDDPEFFTIDVRHHLDDGSNDNTPTVTLIGGTATVDEEDVGNHLLIATRERAIKAYSIIMSQLLGYLHKGIEPTSELLTYMKTRSKLDAELELNRKQLEDIFDTIIE